jgi:PD-(D/E)XK nuclease superfamily protein
MGKEMVLQGSQSGEGISYESAQDTDSPSQAPSPFLEGTKIQYAWDATSIGALKTCPRYYQYTLIDNWRKRGDAIHLRFGIEVGRTIDDYTHSKALGVNHDDSIHDSIRALLTRIADWEPEPRTKSEGQKSKEALVRTIIWYLDHYKNDAAEVVMLANGKPAVELSFKFELEFGPDLLNGDPLYGQPYLLCGHLDKVVSFSGDLFVMDHKTTTGTLGSYYFDQYSPHNQMSAYTIASQTIMKSPIKGVIIDGIQVVGESDPKRKTEPYFRRGITYRTFDQLNEWLSDLRRWLAQAERYAEEGFWPMNDTACSMYGGCRFREVCSKSPQVREKWLKSNFTQEEERWNPLKPR